MHIREFVRKTGDATVGSVLVAAGALLVPVPGAAWYLLADEMSDRNRYVDEGPWLSSLIATMLVGLLYACLIAPAIWKRRSFPLDRVVAAFTVADDGRSPADFTVRKRRIVYALTALLVPVLTLIVGAAWTLGDRQAAMRGVGLVPAFCAFVLATAAYLLVAVPLIRKATFTPPPAPRDPIEEAFAGVPDDPFGVVVRTGADFPVHRRYTLGGFPGPFWENELPDLGPSRVEVIVTPYRPAEPDDPRIEIGPHVEVDMDEIERLERGDEPALAAGDQFAPTERAVLVAPIVTVQDEEPEFRDEDWFT